MGNAQVVKYEKASISLTVVTGVINAKRVGRSVDSLFVGEKIWDRKF